jgi:hypothetical protein
MVYPEQSHVNLFQAYNKTLSTTFQPYFDKPMKKLLILALALAPAVASAQSTTTFTASTTIRDAFALTKVADLAFGNVESGAAVSIASATDEKTAGSTATRAVITSTAASATVYTISGLSISGQTATPTISLPYVSGASGTPDANITVTLNFAVNSASPTAYTLNTTTGASADTGNTLYIGGSFTAPSTAGSVGGLYSGTLTVSAVYL